MRKAIAATLLVVALLLAGCGGSGAKPNGLASKPGQQVLADTVKAAKSASSFHMSGKIKTSGQEIDFDLTIAKGKGATGSMTLGGQKVDLMVVGANAYLKASSAFWKQFGGSQGAIIASLVADKWFKFPTGNPQFASFTTLANPQGLFDSLASNSGQVTNKGVTTYDGQSVVDLYGGSNDGDLYVAATGTAYPVAIVKKGTSDGGSITFADWNQSVTLTAPSGSIDISKLPGHGG